jgi:anti-sigma regulatory factor (Ser/Thr protein kinase)
MLTIIIRNKQANNSYSQEIGAGSKCLSLQSSRRILDKVIRYPCQGCKLNLTRFCYILYKVSHMARPSRQNQEVREFILRNVAEHPGSVARLAAEKFGLTRTTVSSYMKRLVAEDLISSTGNTYARRYSLNKIVNLVFSIGLSAGLSEDAVWRFRVVPHLKNVKQNVLDICQYGFTEMLNNAIDHSASNDALVVVEQTYTQIFLSIIDHGVGIFDKIQKDFDLIDARSALLELSKGKLTSDTSRHSGEGIFYTSRMFDEFDIRSGYLFYSRVRKDDSDWLIETEERPRYEIGTVINMRISTDAHWTMLEVFNSYQNDDIGFRRTHVPVKLAKYPGEQLVSRSQAKRILARFERFSEVLLDFQGVSEIGQPFADEIFRVYKASHPGINVMAIRTNEPVQRMINQAIAAREEPTPTGAPF